LDIFSKPSKKRTLKRLKSSRRRIIPSNKKVSLVNSEQVSELQEGGEKRKLSSED
jgi:hypothetical protein